MQKVKIIAIFTEGQIEKGEALRTTINTDLKGTRQQAHLLPAKQNVMKFLMCRGMDDMIRAFCRPLNE